MPTPARICCPVWNKANNICEKWPIARTLWVRTPGCKNKEARLNAGNWFSNSKFIVWESHFYLNDVISLHFILNRLFFPLIFLKQKFIAQQNGMHDEFFAVLSSAGSGQEHRLSNHQSENATRQSMWPSLRYVRQTIGLLPALQLISIHMKNNHNNPEFWIRFKNAEWTYLFFFSLFF